MAETCPICGHALQLTGRCPACRGWRCLVCGEPAYRDESVCYTGLGKMHLRCSGGVARPRPEGMQEAGAVVERELD
jgi:hypothetical protein